MQTRASRGVVVGMLAIALASGARGHDHFGRRSVRRSIGTQAHLRRHAVHAVDAAGSGQVDKMNKAVTATAKEASPAVVPAASARSRRHDNDAAGRRSYSDHRADDTAGCACSRSSGRDPRCRPGHRDVGGAGGGVGDRPWIELELEHGRHSDTLRRDVWRRHRMHIRNWRAGSSPSSPVRPTSPW